MEREDPSIHTGVGGPRTTKGEKNVTCPLEFVRPFGELPHFLSSAAWRYHELPKWRIY
jgi:hypothetical protein